MTWSLREFSGFIWWMQTERRVGWFGLWVRRKIGRYHPQTPSPFIIITQLISTEGGRLSRPRHCSKSAQPVPKAVYRSDKHFKMKWVYCGRVDCEIFMVWDAFVAEKQWEFCEASRHSAIASSNCTPVGAECILWSAQLNDAAAWSISYMLLIRLLLLCSQQLVHVVMWQMRRIHSLCS